MHGPGERERTRAAWCVGVRYMGGKRCMMSTHTHTHTRREMHGNQARVMHDRGV